MMQLRRTEFMGEKLSTNVHNQQGSTKCISRLTRSIFYNIYFERKLLPEEYFVTSVIEGIPVKEFGPHVVGNPRVLKVNKWIEDLVRSIEKKQLKSVSLDLLTVDSDELVESYRVKYSYRDEKTMKKIPEQFTANSIQTMLKNMKNIFKNKLNPLMDKRKLKFKVTADTSGSGEECCVFQQELMTQLSFEGDDAMVNIEMGTVCTPYHRLIFRMTADPREDNDTQNDVIIIETSQKSPEPEIIELDDDPDLVDGEGDSSICASSYQASESSKPCSTILELSNCRMSCICGTEIRSPLFQIIQCANCSTYQHAECYGIERTSKLPRRHLCHDCSCLLINSFCGRVRSPCGSTKSEKEEENTHTDPRLIEYTIGELKEIGRIRLVLIYVLREKANPVKFMETIFTKMDFQKLLAKLEKLGLIDEDNQKLRLSKCRGFIRRHFRSQHSIDKYF